MSEEKPCFHNTQRASHQNQNSKLKKLWKMLNADSYRHGTVNTEVVTNKGILDRATASEIVL